MAKSFEEINKRIDGFMDDFRDSCLQTNDFEELRSTFKELCDENGRLEKKLLATKYVLKELDHLFIKVVENGAMLSKENEALKRQLRELNI